MPPPDSIAYDHDRLETVARELAVRCVVLFGSRATGTPPPTPESDLDVAILAGPPDAPRAWWDCYETLSDVFSQATLDLVMLHEADPLFRYEIMRSGVLLYGDPDVFLEYKAFAYRDFVDSADLRALEEALFQKKMAYLRSL